LPPIEPTDGCVVDVEASRDPPGRSHLSQPLLRLGLLML
jgi:hypothetical protein